MKVIEYDEKNRVETGVIQFGDDWPGLFIRGDNALGLSLAIEAVMYGKAGPFEQYEVEEFLRKLRSVDARAKVKP